MIETTTDFAVRRTWPDGHVEIDDLHETRNSAERTCRWAEPGDPALTPLARTVTDSGWVHYNADEFARAMAAAPGAEIWWGAELTWLDGFSEVRTGDGFGRVYKRRNAEQRVQQENTPDDTRNDDYPQVTAVLVYRIFTRGEWSEIPMTTAALQDNVLADLRADLQAAALHGANA